MPPSVDGCGKLTAGTGEPETETGARCAVAEGLTLGTEGREVFPETETRTVGVSGLNSGSETTLKPLRIRAEPDKEDLEVEREETEVEKEDLAEGTSETGLTFWLALTLAARTDFLGPRRLFSLSAIVKGKTNRSENS